MTDTFDRIIKTLDDEDPTPQTEEEREAAVIDLEEFMAAHSSDLRKLAEQLIDAGWRKRR